MRRGTWFSAFAAEGGVQELAAATREGLARLDERLFQIWNLGGNVLLGWTRVGADLLFLSVRHYVIPESVHVGAGDDGAPRDALFVDEVLAGPKYLDPARFARVCRAFRAVPEAVRLDLPIEDERLPALVSDMVRCYGVSLVRNRAVMLLDAVQFSLQPPLDQVAMLNSLAYSVNSAYAQLLSKDIKVDFARTTTGDGFYIWNRATTPEANAELYKLMMMILADNAAAQRKARSAWVPRLRAAFHVGEHYEFHQVEGLNPTNFSYIVGQVTVDLARMVERAVPGQILLGDFVSRIGGDAVQAGYGTLDFVENTAATLDELQGLDISGGRVEAIRCYLTGPRAHGGFAVDRYHLRDKHAATRTVYNAKINLHRDRAEPIFLGIRGDELTGFNAWKVEQIGPRLPASGAALAFRERVE